jgi:pimeloyl-ACP methyl ester carboxylesterase
MRTRILGSVAWATLVLVTTGCNQMDEKATGILTDVVTVDDARIEYFSQGSGEAIVMLSGRGLDVGYLEPLAAELAKAGYRAIRVNRRGVGKSTGQLTDITYHTHAKDVSGVVQALGLKRVDILGQALGGRIARTFAADYPSMTRSAILVPGAGLIEAAPDEAKAMQAMFKPGATQDEIMAGMSFMVGDPKDRERVWNIVQPSSITDPATLKSETTTTAPFEDWWAPEGPMPYLVIQGLKDRSALPENSRKLKEELGARVTLIELPNAGHLSPVESPNEVSSAIVTFLKMLPREAEKS